MLLIHQMDGYSSKTYFQYEESEDDDEEEDQMKIKVKYTVLKEEDFIDEEEE